MKVVCEICKKEVNKKFGDWAYFDEKIGVGSHESCERKNFKNTVQNLSTF